jgi:hypothetical protein
MEYVIHIDSYFFRHFFTKKTVIFICPIFSTSLNVQYIAVIYILQLFRSGGRLLVY